MKVLSYIVTHIECFVGIHQWFMIPRKRNQWEIRRVIWWAVSPEIKIMRLWVSATIWKQYYRDTQKLSKNLPFWFEHIHYFLTNICPVFYEKAITGIKNNIPFSNILQQSKDIKESHSPPYWIIEKQRKFRDPKNSQKQILNEIRENLYFSTVLTSP